MYVEKYTFQGEGDNMRSSAWKILQSQLYAYFK